jgi:hypothetical protein
MKSDGDQLKKAILLKMCAQCAAGLVYLEEKAIVHRDIAAR